MFRDVIVSLPIFFLITVMVSPLSHGDEESTVATTAIDGSTARPVDREDVVSEEENHLAGGAPLTVPLQYISEAKFWFKVLTPWPLTWLVVNVLVLGKPEDEIVVYPYVTERNIWSLAVKGMVLCVDAWLLCATANFVEQQVRALAELQEQPDGDSALPLQSNLDHVHARASRRLDEFLGRRSRRNSSNSSSSGSSNNRPKSALVSLLLLGCVFTAPPGCAYLFGSAATGLARVLCPTRYHREVNASPAGSDEDIPGIPHELQSWAEDESMQNTYWGYNEWALGDFVHLIDGTSFVATKMDASWKSSPSDYPWRQASDPVLVAFPATGGHMQVLANVGNPQKFVVLGETNESSREAAPGFCCLYKWSPTPKIYSHSISILCVDSSDSASSFVRQNGEFRNVTLFDPYQMRGQADTTTFRDLHHALLKWHDNSIWAKVKWSSVGGTVTEFFNLTVVKGTPLQLVPVANVSVVDSTLLHMCKECFALVEDGNLAFGAALLYTSYWLLRVRNLPVGVVPTFGIAYTVLAWAGLQTFMPMLISLAAFLVLMGCKIPLLYRLGSEVSVWLLYTSLVTPMFEPDAQEDIAILALIQAAVVGCILGHPVLLLVGWIGGVYFVTIGVLFFWFGPDVKGLFVIVTAIIGGIGCVTAGNLQAKYQEFMWFHAKRAWNAVKVRLQRVAMGTSPSQPMTAGLLENSD